MNSQPLIVNRNMKNVSGLFDNLLINIYNRDRNIYEVIFMGSTEIRQPVQKRSIDKKKRIIDVGFKLFCEKGYHNTNTAEIAKEAGVSTGIVYNYFKDKKDIFLASVQYYSDNVTGPIFDKLASLDKPLNVQEIVREFITMSVKSHYLSESAHEEMMAMSHSDKDVGAFFKNFEITTASTIVDLLNKNGITAPNLHEKVHIAVGLIENLCHEVIFHRHPSLNYDAMTDEIVNIITHMIKV